MKRWVGPMLVALVVVLLGYGLLKEESTPKSPLEGKPASEFTLKSLEGQTYQLNQLKGRPVVINFWASWCLPCRSEAPVLRHLFGLTGDQVQFLGVLFNDHPGKLPTLLDPGSKVALNYGISQVPVTLVLDQKGTRVTGTSVKSTSKPCRVCFPDSG